MPKKQEFSLWHGEVPESERHPAYEHVRTSDFCADERDYLDGMWARYAPFADKHFRDQFQRDFPSRVWEMEVALMLLDLGYSVTSQNHGPDLCFCTESLQVWVEAVAPEPGSGRNAVPERKWGPVPDEEILLRYSDALSKKHRKRQEYLADGLVSADDAFVIAVSGAKVPLGDMEEEAVPRILKVLFGLGKDFFTLSLGSGEVRQGGYHFRPTLETKSGSARESAFFVRPEYAAISAVVFGPNHVKNRPESYGGSRGYDVVVAHNPLARAPLPHGTIRLGREYWAESNEIQPPNDCRPPLKRPPAFESPQRFRVRRRVQLRRCLKHRHRGATLDRDETVLFIERRGRWAYVSIVGPGVALRHGWVPKKYLNGPLWD